MGITDEAARLRENVPEEFQVSANASALTGAFPSLLAQNPYADAISLDDPQSENPSLTEQEKRNRAATLKGEELNENRLAENAGIRAGRIEITGLGNQEKEQARARDKAKADADARMQQLLALQAQIEALEIQIGNLEDALGYLARTGDVDGTMEMPGVDDAIKDWEARTGKKFDPNDPNAKVILKGIIEDDIKAKKEQKQEMEAKVSDQIADREQEQGGRAVTVEEASADTGTLSEIETLVETTGDTETLERNLLALEDLAQFKGTSAYAEKIDEFIENAAAKTLTAISDDPTSDPELVARIDLHNFYEELSYLDEFKGTPDYQSYVKMAVDETSDAVRQALRNEQNLSEDLTVALYTPYSDELDNKNEVAAADGETATENRSEQDYVPAAKPFGLG